jgi:transposase
MDQEFNTRSGRVVFKPYAQNQIMLLPPCLEDCIPEKHLVRIVNQVIEGIELSLLEKSYAGGGASSYHPKMMLKILVYAYCTKIYSCRNIARELEQNVHFMWLAAQQRPDFRTINNFRSGAMKELIEKVFGKVLDFLMEQGYVKMESYFVDGTKMRADANKSSHVWAKNTKRYKEGVQKKICDLFEEIDKINRKEDERYGEKNLEEYGENSQVDQAAIIKKSEELNKAIKQIRERGDKEKYRSIQSKQRQLQRQKEKLTKYEKQQQVLNGRNSYSKTDKDATFMRLKNGQLMPAYNVVQGTENQFIVNYTIHQTASDVGVFVPHMRHLSKYTHKMPKNVIGDAGFGSEENYDYLKEEKISNYLKYSDFYFEQSKKYKENRFHKDNFQYNKKRDQFICPNRQILDFDYQTTKTSKSGYKNTIRVYKSRGCADCPMAHLCKKGVGDRMIKFSPAYEKYKQIVKENLKTTDGIRLRKQRGVDVETPFGDIKYNMGYSRFRLRGLEKVNIEWGLLSIAHNLRKVQIKMVE